MMRAKVFRSLELDLASPDEDVDDYCDDVNDIDIHRGY